jgi:signal transduction histidine kinase
MATAERPRRAGARAGPLTVGQLLAVFAVVPVVVVLAAVVVGFDTLSHSSTVRGELLNRLDPANLAAAQLGTALVDQETGVRGYELAAERSFLEPFTLGTARAERALAQLGSDHVVGSTAALAAVEARVAAWRSAVALPAIKAVQPGRPSLKASVDAANAKHLFDQVRVALTVLQARIAARVAVVRARLDSSAQATRVTLAVIALILILTVLAASYALRRTVNVPLASLARSARRVAGGELSHEIVISGPRDIERLAGDVEAMRLRLLAELTATEDARAELAVAANDLRRSNAELEQFAYVASHDLQEPLRKVTSFCQLLQQRYGGELDERADQYIEFAVDGAKRMQELINDLLAFSRVGRVVGRRVETPLSSLAGAAIDDLSDVVGATGAEVTVADGLPSLSVEPGLIRAVFQNLISNSIKFHGDDPPRVAIDSARDGPDWVISVADNGIGIDPEYADRIFVIFQRLHGRDRYEGTGIGLAMCRKVIEHHGGRIWLDTEYGPGSRFKFTLPGGSLA